MIQRFDALARNESLFEAVNRFSRSKHEATPKKEILRHETLILLIIYVVMANARHSKYNKVTEVSGLTLIFAINFFSVKKSTASNNIALSQCLQDV